MKNHRGKLLCLITALFVTGMAGAENYPATVDIHRMLVPELTKRIIDPIFLPDTAAKTKKAHDEISHFAHLDRIDWNATVELWEVEDDMSKISESALSAGAARYQEARKTLFPDIGQALPSTATTQAAEVQQELDVAPWNQAKFACTKVVAAPMACRITHHREEIGISDVDLDISADLNK
jgi:hypothetical protein